jgi:DNA-directed RNA polymerase specialized sigma subunit
VQKLVKDLSDEDKEILQLWLVQEYSFSKIGDIIGRKYRGKPLSGSGIRYLRDKIVEKMKEKIQKEL